MKIFTIIVLAMMANIAVLGQTFHDLDEMPEYPGGAEAMLEYLSHSIKYPADAQRDSIEGKVLVSFVIDTDGKVTDAKVVESVCPSCDAEALRVVNSMPKWKPGVMKGKNVRVKYRVPIRFDMGLKKEKEVKVYPAESKNRQN